MRANPGPPGAARPIRDGTSSADNPRGPRGAEVGRTLREAQRLLTAGEVPAAVLQVSRALEWVQNVDWVAASPLSAHLKVDLRARYAWRRCACPFSPSSSTSVSIG